MTLPEVIRELVREHGSLVQIERTTGVNASYLSKLRSGRAKRPTNAVLNKLGIKRADQYERVHTK